jgi:carbamoyl-phosphate synthase large subunit
VKDWNGLCKAAEKLGYPERTVVLRRKTGKGAIGLRILTEDPRLGSHVFNRQPDGKMIPLGALKYFIARHKNWPPCMVTEYLPGREFDVDCFCSDDGLEVAATRRNDAMLHGSSWRAVTVDRPDLADSCRRLLDSLRWKYVCSVTFREDEAGIPALLEVNGRMPSSINLTWKAGCNLPLAALLLCAGQPRLPQSSPRPGVRMVRYFAESFLFP